MSKKYSTGSLISWIGITLANAAYAAYNALHGDFGTASLCGTIALLGVEPIRSHIATVFGKKEQWSGHNTSMLISWIGLTVGNTIGAANSALMAIICRQACKACWRFLEQTQLYKEAKPY